jgi:hypothetical protein
MVQSATPNLDAGSAHVGLVRYKGFAQGSGDLNGQADFVATSKFPAQDEPLLNF